MALAALASTADLTARGITWTSPAEDSLVTKFLAEASTAVREAAGVPISRVTSTVVVAGGANQWLRLPGPPVASVSSVSIDGTAVASTDRKLVDDRLWRCDGWRPLCEPSLVTVTMVHGLLEVPEDIIGMVCVLVAAALRAKRAATDGTGLASPPADVTSIAIDDYRVSFAQNPDDRQVTVFTIPERVKDSLRSRFGGGVAMVPSR